MRHLVLPMMVGVALGLAVAACGSHLTPCQTNAQCGGDATCLPVHLCAAKCTRDPECPSGERCSAAQGCIPDKGGWCAVDGDCAKGQVCLSSAVCSGGLLPDGGHLPPGANPDAGPQSCGGQRFTATKTPANVLIILDHSGSMMDFVGGVTKWSAAVSAVETLTAQSGAQVRFGLAMFSYHTQLCHPGGVLVPVGDNTSAAISSVLPLVADGQGTPLAAAIGVAGQATALTDPTRANYTLIITDGEENCGGDPVDSVRLLFNRSVRSYVVGFGGEVDPVMLNHMAVQGGTARQGGQRYYQADNAADLGSALQAIAQGAIGCDFALTQTPPDPNKLYVAIDGQLVPRDPARHSGWEYTPATNRVTLYGPACDALTNTAGAKLDLVYGCPDYTLIEQGGGGHGDGGINFGLDAGDIN